ncbi:O-antigen ligase family protein [Lactococcus lactis]|nr:O-antigen ligase family protein [Lactococcus lactis]
MAYLKFGMRFNLLLIGLTPLVDTINGYLVMYNNSYGSSLFQAIRVFTFISILILLAKLDKKSFFESFIITIFLISISLIQLVMFSSQAYFGTSFSYAIKVSLFFSIFKLFENTLRNDYYAKDSLASIRLFAYLMPILFIIPNILGISRSTYSSIDVGNAGLFIANNSAGIALISSTLILLLLVMDDLQRTSLDSIFLFLGFIALYQQSLRSSYVIILLCMFFIINKIFFTNKLTTWNFLIILIIGLLIFLSIIFLINNTYIIKNFFSGFTQRQQFLRNSENNSFVEILTSGRTFYLKNILDYWPNLPFLAWFIGVGQGYLSNVIGHISEMDIFDLYFYFGIIGLYVSYWTTFSYIKKNQFLNWKPSYKLVFLIVLGYSILGGHVYWEVISSTSFVLLIYIISYLQYGGSKTYNEK